ncbi:MAG: nucleotidyltransferase [Candidatus Bathyarchaeia archaeon]
MPFLSSQQLTIYSRSIISLSLERLYHSSSLKFWTAMSHIPEQVKLCLKDLIERLKKYRVKYMVIGAIPIHFYGRPRTSADIDVVLVSHKDKERLHQILANRYVLYYDGKNVLKFIDNVTKTGVDILLSLKTVGLNQESLKRIRKVKVDDLTIPVPCPEDYIITKLKARRPDTFDFSDVMSVLLNMHDKIDWEYLTKRAKEEKLSHLIEYYREGLKWKIS